MGLDAYVYVIDRTMNEINSEVDLTITDEDYREEIYSWHNNYGLQTFMANLYYDKGGNGEFNCNTVVLTEDDIDTLETALPFMEWSEHEDSDNEREEQLEYDKRFIEIARETLKQDWVIYYYSWW